LFLVYGEPWVLDYAAKLMDQDPLFVSGSPNIAKDVARAEAPLGITSFSNIIEQKRLGNPVEVAPLEVTGVVPQVLVPLEGSPHPNAAKLFAAWLATDGMLMLQESDGTGRAWPGTDWIMAKQLEKAGVKLAFASTPEQIETAAGVVAKVSKIMQKRR
jgi:ABC-type Fe3+ transport system substrate-binding protein